ncbi:MAG: hypothetical protein ABIK67_05840, partial [candidate division WOR-3 bacterium]
MVSYFITIAILLATQPLLNKVRIVDHYQAKVHYFQKVEAKSKFYGVLPSLSLENYDTLYNDDGIPTTTFSSVNWWAQ